MLKLALPLAAGIAMLASTPAQAQTFVFDVDWGPVERFPGLEGADGPQYAGGIVSGNYSLTNGDGTTDTGTVKCVGQGQPDGGIFAIHLSCTANSSTSDSMSSLVYGCNFLGEPGPETPISCVGGLEGRSGEAEGWRGAVTMHWYSGDKATGTGQWFVPAE